MSDFKIEPGSRAAISAPVYEFDVDGDSYRVEPYISGFEYIRLKVFLREGGILGRSKWVPVHHSDRWCSLYTIGEYTGLPPSRRKDWAERAAISASEYRKSIKGLETIII